MFHKFLEKVHSYDFNDGSGAISVIPISQAHLEIKTVSSKFIAVPPKPSKYKYYQEAFNQTHFDARFYDNYSATIHPKSLPLSYTNSHLVDLMRSFSKFTKQFNIQEWWIAHGTLLAWFWNQKIFPFDTDIDIQVTLWGLNQLWGLNGTVFENKFLLDVNPNSHIRGLTNRQPYDLNVIDARFIDMDTGNFIDITAITSIMSQGGRRRKDAYLSCKSPHYYRYDELFPLTKTFLEGDIEVNRPNQPLVYIMFEYGEVCLFNRFYKNYTFKENEWILHKCFFFLKSARTIQYHQL